MTREDLLTLLSAWGWSLRGQANGGALDVWEKGRHSVYLPNGEGGAEYDELLTEAEWMLATVEGPRLLAVVREVAEIHRPHDRHPHLCAGCEVHNWPCSTATALTPLTKETR